MGTAYAVAAVGCRPLLSLVGRRGPRALMILGSLVSLVGFAAHLRVDSLTVLACGRAIGAIGEAMIWVGYGTYVSSLAPPGRQAEAISLSTVAVFGGIGVGPLIGDPLARAGRFDLAVLIALGFVLVCALTSFTLRRSWYPESGPIRRGRLTWREVIHPAALPTGIVLALAMVGWSAWSTFVALHGDAIGMASIAPVFTLYAVLALGFRLVGAKVPERLGLARCASGSLTGIALGLAVLTVIPSEAGVYAGTVVLAGGVALMYPALSALTLQRAPDPGERAAVLGSFSMFFEVGVGAGGLALGALADRSGERAAFGLGGLVTAAGLVLLTTVLRHPAHRSVSAPA